MAEDTDAVAANRARGQRFEVFKERGRGGTVVGDRKLIGAGGRAAQQVDRANAVVGE